MVLSTLQQAKPAAPQGWVIELDLVVLWSAIAESVTLKL